MSTARKKQEDKHVKMLRDLAALPSNKNCFDCHQRGPMYVNMTVGSFICVSCSGKLRGLNPPHRVKSISMASFTAEEVDFLKSRGNEYCNSVWMGNYDSQRCVAPDFKDDQKMIEFLTMKYEKKSWYVEPTNSQRPHTPLNSSPSPQLSSPSSVGSADSRSIGSINLQLQTNRSATPRPNVAKAADLLSGLPLVAASSEAKVTTNGQSKSRPSSGVWGGNLPALSSSSQLQAQSSSKPQIKSIPQGGFRQPDFANFENFANFESNPVFQSEPSLPKPVSATSSPAKPYSPPVKSNPPPPSEDRYAALKDLDLVFGSSNNNEVVKTDEWSSLRTSKLSNSVNRSSWAGSTGGLNIFDSKGSVFDSPQSAWGTPPKTHVLQGSFSTQQINRDVFTPSPNPFIGATPVITGSSIFQQSQRISIPGAQNPFSSPSLLTGTGFGKSPIEAGLLNGNNNQTKPGSFGLEANWAAFGSPLNQPLVKTQQLEFTNGISPNPFASGVLQSMPAAAMVPKSSYNPFL